MANKQESYCLARTMKIEVVYSSEMSVDFHQTTWHYFPEDRGIQAQESCIINQYSNPTNNLEFHLGVIKKIHVAFKHTAL